MNTPQSAAEVHSWLIEPMSADVARSIKRLACSDDVRYLAVMSDVHLARDVCIGTAVATSELVYPFAVGSDIGCGMAAMRIDGDVDMLADERRAARLLSGLYRDVPSNQHSARTMPDQLPEPLVASVLSHPQLEKINHVQREVHWEREYWVHRKGAQSARSGEPGIIPGSMGTASFHVAGRGCEESLCSSSHGAGRKMSRTDARRTISRRKLDRQMASVWFDHRRAESLRDEAPGAYKDIHAVMRTQKKLTRIVRGLRPILSYKGV